MKFVGLLCLVVVTVEARPQSDPKHQGLVNIAEEFAKFHQLWLAEAKRNSIAPVSPFNTQITVAEQFIEPQPIAEAPAPAPKTQPIQKTVAAAPATAEANENIQAQPAAVTFAPPPDMNAAIANFQALWEAEAARNAIAPTRLAFVNSNPAVTFQANPEPVQPVAEVEQAIAPLRVQPAVSPVVRPAVSPVVQDVARPIVSPILQAAVPFPDYQADFARFHELWRQEAARNAIAPVFNSQPAAVQPEVTPKIVTPVVPVPAPVPKAITPAATSSVVPNNIFSGFRRQPIIVILPNFTPAMSTKV
ncbi:hypothetical protein SK128_015066 [Halocaridina rubra]|uniref:Uncharacterized protein n=1 Tax=Halocaridina rubra TaxID=373956 RepID=A0AAN8XGL1_HALRR